jgi:hypothetical protein
MKDYKAIPTRKNLKGMQDFLFHHGNENAKRQPTQGSNPGRERSGK